MSHQEFRNADAAPFVARQLRHVGVYLVLGVIALPPFVVVVISGCWAFVDACLALVHRI